MSSKKSSNKTLSNKSRESFATKISDLIAKDASKAKIAAYKEKFALKHGLSLGQVHALHAWANR